MEGGLGKRQQRESSSDDEESSHSKRPRHDSDQSEDDEQVLQRVRAELLEEEAFKHLTEEQIKALLDQAEDQEEVKLDRLQIKRMVTQMRALLNVNLERRLQDADEPEGFLESEAELHGALKQLQSISAYPQHVADFIKSEGVDSLIEVLEHPNPDISIESVTMLTELTEEDVL